MTEPMTDERLEHLECEVVCRDNTCRICNCSELAEACLEIRRLRAEVKLLESALAAPSAKDYLELKSEVEQLEEEINKFAGLARAQAFKLAAHEEAMRLTEQHVLYAKARIPFRYEEQISSLEMALDTLRARLDASK